jgi:hypothetical protein
MTTTPVQPKTSGWTADDGTFGARLALIRQRMQWGNVKEAALACGVPVESWRTWERDGRVPRNIVQIARQISEQTGCDYLWLLIGQQVEGSAVVSSSGNTGQTTVPTLETPVRPTLNSHPKRAVPSASSRRPARTIPFIAELMPDTPSPELLAPRAA